MAPPALLLVFSDLGAQVTEDEYNDWCDNEHIPLRVALPSFHNCTRWKAADGAAPAWAGTYDLAAAAALTEPAYTGLAETRSARERRVLRDIALLERRVYELLDPRALPPPSALFDARRPARFASFVAVDVRPGAEEVLERWYGEHIAALAALPGWVRSRRFVLTDWSRSGVEGQEDRQPIPRYLAVHEWESMDAVKSPEVQESFLTPLKAELDRVVTARQLRVFERYKHWEGK
ncbi:hypothetical protein PHLGIDRAFT_115733 [Phlebiopsis gigantea 11061_1 CR5-6]|uniref:ABM domain-containing protein n=1 Tax=Phlebiopsis gigantea (strain 11061_1 CR5-6) TaxID=745531 RepID=A0A0C3S3H3_PHLG1|nr:hypothetical protein PHLGIDRAFT_115733 [Phlebiopsis gigantea 11061_1 CR5-6]